MNMSQLNALIATYNIDPTNVNLGGEHDIVYLDISGSAQLPIAYLMEDEELESFTDTWGICNENDYWAFLYMNKEMLQQYLKLKLAEYLATLDDSYADEAYISERAFADWQVSKFLDWLKENE